MSDRTRAVAAMREALPEWECEAAGECVLCTLRRPRARTLAHYITIEGALDPDTRAEWVAWLSAIDEAARRD